MMDTRILRIELRRSSALGAGLGIASAGVFLTYALYLAFGSGQAWFGLAILQRDILAFTFPLALGAGAWQARRDRKSRMEELLAATPRRRFSRVLPIAATTAIAMAAAYLLMLAVTAAIGLRPADAYFPAGAIPVIAIGALALIAAAWLGLAIGKLLPSALTAPILAVAALIAFVIGPGILGATIAVPILPAKLADMYVPDPAATAPFCTPDPPKICVGRVHAADLPSLQEPGREALAILAAKLPPAPSRVEIYVWTAPAASAQHRAQTLTVEFNVRSLHGETQILPAHYVWYMLAGAGVGLCTNMPSTPGSARDEYLASRWAAAAWLIGKPLPPNLNLLQGDPDTIPQLTAHILQALSSLPADDQRAHIAALRQAEIDCTPGDRIAILTAASRP